MRKGSLFPLLGVFFSFATTVLIVFTLIGSIKPVAVLSDIYFMKLDAKNLGSDIIPSYPRLSDADTQKLHQFEYYTVGLWGYCWSTSKETVGCTKASGRYHFALVDIVYKTLGYFVTVNAPGNLADNDSKIQAMSQSLIILYIVAGAFALALFILSIVSIVKASRGQGRVLRVITALISLITFALTLVSSAVALGLYLYIKENINDHHSVIASIGRTGFGISWGSALAGLLAFICTLISICTAPRKNAASSIPEKQPFLDTAPPPPVSFTNTQYPPSVAGGNSGYYNPPPQSNHGGADMFNNNYTSYHGAHGHSGSMSNEPMFIQPTYYDQHGGVRN